MEDNVVLKGVAWVGITASCLRLSFRSHENDSCENSSGRDGYVDKVDGLGGLNRLGIGIDSLIHDATS